MPSSAAPRRPSTPCCGRPGRRPGPPPHAAASSSTRSPRSQTRRPLPGITASARPARRSLGRMPTFVIAGASLAGAKAAETLRDEGFDGEIVLVGSEPERPYERPPLSKGYLLGNDSRDSIYVHAADWYDEHGVDLRRGVTVTAIDRGTATVALSGPAGDEELSYDKLLLTIGA